jgi:hypothetical protein
METYITHIIQEPIFREVLEMVKENSRGQVWLTGGFLYRNIIAYLYGGEVYTYDIDFVVEHKNTNLIPYTNWNIAYNSYHNPNYVHQNHKMSFTSLPQTYRVSGKTPHTIDEFLSEVPYTIQSIAYNVDTKTFHGTAGLDAIIRKTVQIHCPPQAQEYAKRHNTTAEQLLINKATSLGFNYTL